MSISNEDVLKAVADLDKKIDVYIGQQDIRCQDCHEDVVDLQHTTYGNGREGLKTQQTKLTTRVNVLLGILAPVALAAAIALAAWALPLIQKGLAK